MAKHHVNIQTTVQINKDYARDFAKDDFVFEQILVSIHVSVDPITHEKVCIVYTDDGRGNGTPIISFEM